MTEMTDMPEKFQCTYSGSEQEEIRKIREKYLPKEENKLEELRRLDASVERPGRIVSMSVGVLSTLVLGTGMSCVMVWGETLYEVGIIIGIIGLLGIGAAYPIYTRMTKKRREKLAPQILELTEELSHLKQSK